MLYNDQASSFDDRAGIPAEATQSIALALAAIVGLDRGGNVLEVGAGTGMLSLPILAFPVHYIGFDRSPTMLGIFQERVSQAGYTAELHVADGGLRWPAEDGSIDLIISFRALHHVDVDHSVAETLRVLRPEGGWLVLGQVRRPHDSVKSVMRRQMRKILDDEGYSGRSGTSHAEALFSAREGVGGKRHSPLQAAQWSVLHTPQDSLAAWEGKEGLAGMEIESLMKNRIIGRLRTWAEDHYGDLNQPFEQEEIFELSAIEVRISGIVN